MAQKLNIDRIWWRNVQPGEFYNIERHHQINGGGGSLYIEIPSSMVPATLDFLDATGANVDDLPVIKIEARVVGRPGESGPIEFHRKKGGRMRIARQNRRQPNSQRHPAWIAARGFPTAPDDVGSTEDALTYFPKGGLRIYIAKTVEGEYYAGFTKGPRPDSIRSNNPMWDLYPPGSRPVGGVIDAD
ncbi:hypothetical protein LVY72_07500 [Arthrobacter sp. I2-34]|uniref:Uncharacterized protein n=1 Tax=Arthrobacter hankyongi TaxID=2904801 RepID=A0ABS9L515_9MICC|nr:hypothetical protein [Arthrobacter hankyongi]MCG2621762.1 hypothetical protein [Arthrobacter hankyongi]